MIDPKTADLIVIQNDKTQTTYTYAPKIGWVTWGKEHFNVWKDNVDYMDKNPKTLKNIIEKMSYFL